MEKVWSFHSSRSIISSERSLESEPGLLQRQYSPADEPIAEESASKEATSGAQSPVTKRHDADTEYVIRLETLGEFDPDQLATIRETARRLTAAGDSDAEPAEMREPGRQSPEATDDAATTDQRRRSILKQTSAETERLQEQLVWFVRIRKCNKTLAKVNGPYSTRERMQGAHLPV